MDNVLIIHNLVKESGRSPFEDFDMDDSYASISNYSRQLGLNIYVSHESWYDDGIVSQAWIFKGEYWEKEEKIIPKLLFLKITPSRMKGFIDDAEMHGIKIVNNPEMDEILNDKMKTHDLFPEISPFSLKCDKNSLLKSMRMIQLATLHDDLDPVEIFLKPLSLSGGEGIRIIRDFEDIAKVNEGEYLIQPRIITTKRFNSFEIIGNYDCRIVMHNSEIIHCYLRISDSMITNVAKGGKIIYIPLEQIPIKINDTIRMIDKKLENYGNRIYTIDFVIGKSGRFWLIEMNAQPGLTWKSENDQKIREAMILHQHYANYFKESLV
jgi:glutathione synthase/RimK-type ligase-like ATP-grasp enzyme